MMVRLSGLLPLIPLTLVAPQPAAASGGFPPRATLVFQDLFQKPDWGRRGAVWCPYTSAYPNGRTNPDNWKLDRLTPAAISVSQGGGLRLRAEPVTGSPRGPWTTGLITTEPWDHGPCGGDGFTVRPDDYVLVRLRLPNRGDGGGHGAWPGVWLWKGGHSEVDVLEWHSETPRIAEMVNHVDGDTGGFVPNGLLGYGKWVYVGARLGTDTITWYLGDSPRHLQAVYRDGQGVPHDWRAYLVINLSVSAQHRRVPTALTPITTEISSVQVYRSRAARMRTGR
jgi:hypothetical protein